MKNVSLDKNYVEFLREIKNKILSARIRAYHRLNRGHIQLYWDLGKTIVDRQKKYGWGQGIVEELAKDLKREFSGTEGFSANNLWRARNFYLAYEHDSKLARLVQEIPWGQNIVIMQMVKERIQRAYYIKATADLGWSRDVLLNQIKANAYGHSKLKKQHNFKNALPEYLAEQADESIKSVYNLDFLGITKSVKERELEARLVEKIKGFILELGYGFCFIGNQQKVILGGNEYFIDLLFFNRKLRSLVAIELKIGRFAPEYAGKMDFYLHILNDKYKMKDENPPIGIILCATKDDLEVEYALKSVKHPVGVGEYQLTTKLPDKLKGVIPSEREIKAAFKRNV
jgi:predicted nuclease of restriction endonuclease-like (RecB) superfamily